MQTTSDESRKLTKAFLLFEKLDVPLPKGAREQTKAGKPIYTYQCKHCSYIFYSPSDEVRKQWRRGCDCHKVSWRASPLLAACPADASRTRTS